MTHAVDSRIDDRYRDRDYYEVVGYGKIHKYTNIVEINREALERFNWEMLRAYMERSILNTAISEGDTVEKIEIRKMTEFEIAQYLSIPETEDGK